MAKNASPFDLNFPPVNFELDGNSDPIAATLQLSRSHDENHITSVIYPDCSDYIQPSSLHAHLSGIGNAVGSNDPAGICSNSSMVNIQIGENMTVTSHYSNDMAGTIVSPDINLAQQNLGISDYATGFNSCSSVDSIPLGHGFCHPTDATKQSWKNLVSCDNLGKLVLDSSHLNSIQYDNGWQIGSGYVDGSATNVDLTAEQSRNGHAVDYMSFVNGLHFVQQDGKVLDLKTAASPVLFSNEQGHIIEGCNSQRLPTLTNTQLPLNGMWTGTGFHFGSSTLIDSYNFFASTQHSNIINGGIVGQMGNDPGVAGGWPTTAYGASTQQAVFHRTCSNNTSSKSGGWTGVGGIAGLQCNRNFFMDGEPNQSIMFNMREVGENFQKPELDTCSKAPNADVSGIIVNDRTEWPSQFDRKFQPHLPLIVDKEPSNVANSLMRHLVSKPCGARPNSLNGNSLSAFQSLSNCDGNGKSMHQRIWNPVALSKEHKQPPSPFLPQPNLNLKGPAHAFGKGQMSSNSQGLSGSSVKAARKDADIFSPVNLENSLKTYLPRPLYLPTVPASNQSAFTSASPVTVGKPAPMSIRSRASGAMNNPTTIVPSSRVGCQGTLGRQSVPMGIKSQTAGALKDATIYNPPSTGFPQAAGTVIKESKTPAVPRMAAKVQINRLPMQPSPQLPRVSAPDSTIGSISGSPAPKIRAKRICLEAAKTTPPVSARKTTAPVCMPGPLGPTAAKIATYRKHLPTEHEKKLDHISGKDFKEPVKMPLGARCDLCTNDLMFLPKGSSAAYRDDPPMSAVMACRHSFHVACLEEVGCSTERNKDPPCPLCGFSK